MLRKGQTHKEKKTFSIKTLVRRDKTKEKNFNNSTKFPLLFQIFLEKKIIENEQKL